ncbi:CU044_5270 family protein [Streptomyces verrucosisporus]|uniref:CU044_5270 family protein n=1 Tax=Streptomyces verrucosisporus TaxID=1695161 RepID=UPI0019D0EED3|nr:CU044_5270 family protein [Streptomyces verrucosisporus]MBN3928489.1 CU044_5270 family protein [Streptomyces verrucosisporus]
MDEMTRVRDFRADAPTPDRARLAPGRQRLLDAAGHRARPRRLRADWRLAVAGAAVAVTAAALAGSQLVGGGADTAAPPAASSVRPHADLADAATVLRRAADTVEQLPDPEPRDGQWTYIKTRQGAAENGGYQEPSTQESWYRYDDPEFENWKEGDDHSPRERFRFLASLPEDPEKVLERIRWFYPSNGARPSDDAPEAPDDAHHYRAAGVLIKSYPMAHQGLARLYRALATVDGVKVVDHLVEDAAGRDAIALYFEDGGKGPAGFPATRDLLLIDPTTYTYLGTRSTVAEDFSEELPDGTEHGMREGQVLWDTAILRTALVDAEGRRP